MVFEIEPVGERPAEPSAANDSLYNRLADEMAAVKFKPTGFLANSSAVDAITFTGTGAAIGTAAGLGTGYLGARSAEAVGQGLLNLVEPFIGERSVGRIPFSSYAKPFGWRGAVAGAAVGLLAYGAYEGCEYVKSKL